MDITSSITMCVIRLSQFAELSLIRHLRRNPLVVYIKLDVGLILLSKRIWYPTEIRKIIEVPEDIYSKNVRVIIPLFFNSLFLDFLIPCSRIVRITKQNTAVASLLHISYISLGDSNECEYSTTANILSLKNVAKTDLIST